MISHREPLDRPHLGAELAFALAGGPLGRRTLVERTGLTESVVRTELKKLEAMSGRQAQVVECLFFAGLTIPETAEALEISPATVKRDWATARAWLYREMRDESD